MNILICDDDRDIAASLKIYLKAEGYNVFIAYNGIEALNVIAKEDIQLVLLDIMMPGMDGLSALTEIRKTRNLPVIFLTAKGEDTDKVLGLNIGADDYVTKPFNPVVLIARVKSQLRRYLQLGGGDIRPSVITIGAVTLDDNAKTVTVDGAEVSFTPLEYDILKYLMLNAGKVFSPAEIYRQVWHEECIGDNPVAVHIRHIREKIEIDPADPRYLKVVWGKGYKMEGDRR